MKKLKICTTQSPNDSLLERTGMAIPKRDRTEPTSDFSMVMRTYKTLKKSTSYSNRIWGLVFLG